MVIYTHGGTIDRPQPEQKKMINTHLTIENITKLAEKIAATYKITIMEAMELAEFNLTYASSYTEAESRV
jgi:hypothetical protein